LNEKDSALKGKVSALNAKELELSDRPSAITFQTTFQITQVSQAAKS
jgi:hypothetical protein